MIGPRPGQPGPDVVVTARVSGASARLGAVAVAGTLALVVWIGASGRRPPVVPISFPPGPEVAEAASPTPSVTADPTATPLPLVTQPPLRTLPPRRVASIESDDLSVVAKIGKRQFMAWLRPSGTGHLSASFGVPIPPPATHGTLELTQVWRTVEQVWRTPTHDAWTTLSTWDLRLESLSAASGREYVVLDQTMLPRPAQRDVSRLVTRGYRITVRAQSGAPRGVVTIDVEFGMDIHLAEGTVSAAMARRTPASGLLAKRDP